MRKRPPPPPLDLAELLGSWQLHLQSEAKSELTVKSYTGHVRAWLRWCEQTGQPTELTRDAVQAHIAGMLGAGSEPNTARLRLASLRAFTRWLADDGEIDDDPLLGMRPPKLTAKVTAALTDDQLRLLLKACAGKTLRDRRDEAIVRLMLETGLRAGEVIGLHTTDLDLPRGLVTVRRGKGGKGRIAPFSSQTAAALDRYLRARRSHRRADDPALWVGVGGKGFGYHGLNDTLRDRARSAGIDGFHLHLLRHTAATRWLRAGGSEQGLMSVAGWSTRSMIDRYTGASAAERAAAEARSLNLGDL
jgi:site-specific recombinase XerD